MGINFEFEDVSEGSKLWDIQNLYLLRILKILVDIYNYFIFFLSLRQGITFFKSCPNSKYFNG